MTVQGTEFIRVFEDYCPQWLAEQGDPVGLHVGTLNKPIKRVMMTLDVRPEVVAEAVEKKIDLLIAKHPPIFRPIDRLVTDDPQTKMYAELIKHDIAVYAAHTNMDIMTDGLNDWFCDLLKIDPDDYLVKTHDIQYKKLAVFVPIEAADNLRAILAEAGAGRFGDYEAASFTSVGQGRFTPTVFAHPTIGQAQVPEQVQEAKIEVIFPETLETRVLTAMRAQHPYEEPAFDLYPIAHPTKSYGIGRIGNLEKELPLADFLSLVKEKFSLDGLRLIQPLENPTQTVRRVAICGGSGGKFYPAAKAKQADVYLTGDVYYHTAHDMQAAGLTVIDPGHYIEALCKEKFVEKFNEWNDQYHWEIEAMVSETDTNPFQFR